MATATPPPPDAVRAHEFERHFERSAFVDEVACLGWETESDRARLVVVPNRAALLRNGLTGVRELIRFEFETLAAQHLPPVPVPQTAFCFDPLPRTAEGAIDVAALASAGGPHLVMRSRTALPDTAASRMVMEALAAAALAGSQPACDADSNLELDLDLDSLSRAALFADLERRAGHPPTASGQAWDNVFTVGDLVDRTQTLLAASRPSAGPRAGGCDAWRDILAVAPPADAVRAQLERDSPIQGALSWMVLRFLRMLAWPVLRIEAEGLEHLPADGRALICPNHESFLDAFVVSAVLPYRVIRRVFFLGATEYFATRPMARVARAINLVPVDADRNLARAMQLGAFGLRLDRVLVIFPEGERSIDGTVRAFRDGAAQLARSTSSPLVPVATRGLFAVWPRGFGLRWRALRPWQPVRVRVVVGRPLPMPANRTVEDTTRVLRDTVLSLWESATEKQA